MNWVKVHSGIFNGKENNHLTFFYYRSGMDVEARRAIWDLLLVKIFIVNNKTTILFQMCISTYYHD